MFKSVVCFGETLWDLLPAGRQPGGAPLNVAVHARNLGLSAAIISRVGTDDLGRELLGFLAGRGLSLAHVLQDPHHPTGVVKVNVDNRSEVTYDIVQPVAWDYIPPSEALRGLVEQADAFVYGSLAARSPATRATLYGLLPHARLRVLDVNLRPPHYTRDVVEHLLTQADLVKMNHHELGEIGTWLGPFPDQDSTMRALTEHFRLQALCVTLGAAGAVLYTGGSFFRSPGFAVEVADTIGSGDAFLAALLKGYLLGQPPASYLRQACATGSLVATYPGATPAISEAAVVDLLGSARYSGS